LNLEAARNLKTRIRAALARCGSQHTIAIGLGLTNRYNDYRIAVLLGAGRDIALLEEPHVRRVVAEARGEIVMEQAGIAAASGSRAVQVHDDGPVLKIGASVGHTDGGIGSLGFFASRRTSGERGIVSCNHVIAMIDEAGDGDAVVSPSRAEAGAEPRVVAYLDGGYPRLGAAGPVADCAFARVAEGVAYDPASLAFGTLNPTPAVIAEKLAVTKTGRATPARLGIVEKVEIDGIWIRYGHLRVAFNDVIQIGSASSERFCKYGDSGALIYTYETSQPVGLLFATSYVGGPHDVGWTWAHPIQRVADALDVDLVDD
jgi:hypothetical protein